MEQSFIVDTAAIISIPK